MANMASFRPAQSGQQAAAEFYITLFSGNTHIYRAYLCILDAFSILAISCNYQ